MKRLEKDEKEHLEKQTRLIGDEVRSGIFVSSTSFNAKTRISRKSTPTPTQATAMFAEKWLALQMRFPFVFATYPMMDQEATLHASSTMNTTKQSDLTFIECQ
jgi:hypothetical protein